MDISANNAQGARLDPSPKNPYRRRRRRRRRGPPGPPRPGRFFRKRTKLHYVRLAMMPVHLGECDWLLYRRRFNPYKPPTFNAKAYERGFLACKAAFPKPTWSPIP